MKVLKNMLLWMAAIIITVGAAYYQRTTGPTYPKKIDLTVNDSTYDIKLIRSIDLSERSQVKLKISDTTVKANLWFKRFKSDEAYQMSPFFYRVYPVNSALMNKFGITEEDGLFADIPPQPPAGKLQYFIELTDSKGTEFLMKEEPVVIRYKGSVPSFVLVPHILLMFLAMLVSTVAGLMSIFKYPAYKKYGMITLALFIAGGMILGPVVQKFAFGEFWTGIPFGWDLTDNKTLIALIFWILAVFMNRNTNKPAYTALAAIVLLLVYSIPHSMFGSELDYSSGQVIQGVIFLTLIRYYRKIS
jgi:hypothetical protein